MATYRPSFVDVSGLTQGISQGLEGAYLLKKQEDALAESKVDEYLKNYRPDKLRDGDIGAFTGVYNDYKQAALQYGKMNRGGAKPEKLSLAKANMDKALSGLNSVYTNSAKLSNKAADYGDYIKKARLSGLAIPKEITDNYNLLTSGNVNSINADSIRDAYSYELIKKNADLAKLDYIFNNVGAAAVTKNASQKVKVADYGKTPIYGENKFTITSRPVENTIKGVALAMVEDNAMKVDADNLYNIFKEDPYSYMSKLQDVAPGISYEDVTPATLYAMQYFMPKVSSEKIDYAPAKMQIGALEFQNNSNYRDAMLRIQQQRANAAGETDRISKRNLLDPAKDLTIFEQKNQGGKGWIRVPDTQAFQGASKYNFMKANVEYMDYNPETQQYRIKTSAETAPKLYSAKEAKYILTSNTKGATNKPYGEEGDIPTKAELDAAGFDFNSAPELKSLLENMDFSAEDKQD
jgi:hypothetical protein